MTNKNKRKKPQILLIIEKSKNVCVHCKKPECIDNQCLKKDDDDNHDDDKDNKKKDNKKNDDQDENYDDDDYYDDYYNNYFNDDDDDDDYHDKNNYNNDDDDDDDFNKINNNPLDFFFSDILNSIKDKESKPQSKKSKKEKIINDDNFESYFKEASQLTPIDKEIKTLKDLIDLGNSYNKNDNKRYTINLKALNKCIQPLIELDLMIGMKNIKEMIIDLIFFRLQNIQDNKDELWHLVIQGTPGSGKTEVAKIIGKIYYGLGITKKDSFTLVKRSDLIGKYLGHTAKMTQEIFDKAKGGILFIDEAYSLGNPEQRDSFSKECIDTINQNLTENKDTVVFIAGYKDQLNESFFSYNPGLNRRFKMRLTVDKYTPGDLREIFIKKIKDDNWFIFNNNVDKEIPLEFFEKNNEIFKYNGGDMENLWHLTKIVHSRRVFGKSHDLLKKVVKEDLENGLKLYRENDEVKTRSDDTFAKYLQNTMYC
jgi:SpoVK/Ycf46/Vps4 family AAA+-type ATPase